MPIDRVPYVVEAATAALSRFRNVVLVGATKPVAFFAYPGKPGYLYPPDAQVHVLARAEQDPADALAAPRGRASRRRRRRCRTPVRVPPRRAVR